MYDDYHTYPIIRDMYGYVCTYKQVSSNYKPKNL